jgi:hypothetical protein
MNHSTCSWLAARGRRARGWAFWLSKGEPPVKGFFRAFSFFVFAGEGLGWRDGHSERRMFASAVARVAVIANVLWHEAIRYPCRNYMAEKVVG